MAFAESLKPKSLKRPPYTGKSGTSTPGYNSPLNRSSTRLARHGKLTEADLEQIYETYLSQIKTTDRIDKVSARDRRNRRRMTLISVPSDVASYDDSLSRDPKTLGGARPRRSGDRRDAGEIHPRDARHHKALETGCRCRKTRSSNLQQSLEATDHRP
jgi:diguanylate cyclase